MIHTARLSILQARDVEWWDGYLSRVVKWLNDPEAVKYSEQRHRRHSEISQYHWIQGNVATYHGIFSGRHLVGTANVSHDRPNKLVNLGILIGPEYWGQGYGKEAWRALMSHFLNEGCRKIEAGMMAANEAMIKTALAGGMHEEARIKGHFLWNEQPMDLVLMGAQA